MLQILVYADSLSWGIVPNTRELDCRFFDAGQVTRASRVDGVHLDADQHRALGEALAREVVRALRG